VTTPGGPGSINPNARFGITGDNSHGDTVADLQQRLQAAIEGRLKSDIKASQGWKGASDAAFGGLMLRGTPGQPVSISLAIIASLAARLLGINPQTWLISTDPHENIERILAELKKVPILDDLIELITGVEDGDESDLGTWALGIRNALQGIDLSNPGSILTAIGKAAGQIFKGVIPISRIANVVQDLIGGSGEFLNADSVKTNPFWSWDSVMPGFISGGSIRATANGTQQVMRSEPFPVFPGQTLELRAASQWTGAVATAGSNPVKVGFTPFDAAGNPLADVIRGSLQPSGDHSWQWVPVQDKWPVPPGVAHVSELLILDSGATAGTFRFSNASAWASNLLDLGLVKDLREMVDAIGGTVNSEVADITARLQAITADGKITASEIEGLIQQAQVSGLAIIQTIINQILDILNGNLVTPINSLVQGVKDWFGLNQNKTQALNSSGQMSGSAITGAINEAATGLGALRDAIGAGLGFLGGSMTNQDAQNQAILVAQTAAQAAAAAAAANAQLAKSQGQSNTGAGGLSYATTFGGADGAVLPAEFSSSDLGIRGSNGYVGIDASRPDGTYLATCSKMCNSDDQSIAVVLGDQGGSIAAPMYVLFHSDSADTAGAAVRIDYSSVILGSYTRSGSTYSFTPFSGGVWSGSLGQGMLVEAHNVGTSWTISVGGNAVLSVTNSSVTFGPTRRYSGGIVMARATVNLGWFQGTKTYDSFRLAAMTLGDYVIPAYAGSGARIARTSTAVVSCASLSTAGTGSSAHGLIATGYFNVIRESTPDIAVDLSNGKFTVSEPDWYRVTLRYLWAETSNGINDRVALFKNGSIYAFGNPTFSFDNDGTTTTKWSIGGATSWDVYLAAGDNVQAAHSAFQIAGTGTFASVTKYGGDSSGLEAFMTIARK
jgi:hypothetical protein